MWFKLEDQAGLLDQAGPRKPFVPTGMKKKTDGPRKAWRHCGEMRLEDSCARLLPRWECKDMSRQSNPGVVWISWNMLKHVETLEVFPKLYKSISFYFTEFHWFICGILRPHNSLMSQISDCQMISDQIRSFLISLRSLRSYHLTLFGAVLGGFIDALLCSQATLLSSESALDGTQQQLAI
jgi:hypothetical protein